jgi:hypothetical protein
MSAYLLSAPNIAGLLPAGKPKKDSRDKALDRLMEHGFVEMNAALTRHYKGADANHFIITVYTDDFAAITAHTQMIVKAGFWPHKLGISRATYSDNRMTAFSLDFVA